MDVRNIFFDMDEVLADFSRGVREIVGMEPPPQDGKHKDEEDKMWTGIRDAKHFYDRLELVSGAKELFDEVYSKYGYKCEILTAVPKPKRNIPDARPVHGCQIWHGAGCPGLPPFQKASLSRRPAGLLRRAVVAERACG